MSLWVLVTEYLLCSLSLSRSLSQSLSLSLSLSLALSSGWIHAWRAFVLGVGAGEIKYCMAKLFSNDVLILKSFLYIDF